MQGDKEVYLTTDGACTAFQRRPYLKEFLEEVCQHFEVAIFTAGNRVSVLSVPAGSARIWSQRRDSQSLAAALCQPSQCQHSKIWKLG